MIPSFYIIFFSSSQRAGQKARVFVPRNVV
jgi:hypothetical protein